MYRLFSRFLSTCTLKHMEQLLNKGTYTTGEYYFYVHKPAKNFPRETTNLMFLTHEQANGFNLL